MPTHEQTQQQQQQSSATSKATQHSSGGWCPSGRRNRWKGAGSPWHKGSSQSSSQEWSSQEWSSPQWASEEWHGRRRFIFWRFFGFMLFIAFLVAGGMAMFAYHINNFMGGTQQTVGIVWVSGCGLALAFPLLALTVMLRAFRSYALPLADVMTAAEQVADGNLTVRLEERGSREFRQLANSFNRMTAELELTEQQRRNLTADIAHELRTPLHIIQGNLEGVLDGIYEPNVEHIEATLEETRLLARLIEDLRLITLAESGELQLQFDDVNVHDLLADVVTSLSGQAEANGVTVAVEVAATEALTIRADALRLDQVLCNLVTNALRHTPLGGQIIVGAYRQGEEIWLTVRDTGSGIASEDLPFVFDRFWKGDRARTHGTGSGSGLGLAIARQLVEAHGGTIAVESEVGIGTKFTIRLGEE